ncbi:hypothetical protein DL96DRAFT_1610057 [Flagelloscypha sp. PMI_526]|nr:hypothetical protein DL96DRAFT_1610057 [Flagelloscypha sp. PMI_526]
MPKVSALGSTALNYTTPYTQAALNNATIGSVIARADGLANKTLDVVEQNGYVGWVVKAKPEDVEGYVKEKRTGVEENIRSRRESLQGFVKQRAEGIDQSFAPLVDYFASLAPPSENGQPGPSDESKYQYQRALAISQALANYSTEQLNQLRAHQKAEQTAASIQNLATTSYASTTSRIHGLSDSMLVELQKLQASTASISANLTTTSTESVAKIQETFGTLSKEFGETVHSLHVILLEKDLPIQEKVSKVGAEVQSRVQPLLENVRKTVENLIHTAPAPAPTAENGAAH